MNKKITKTEKLLKFAQKKGTVTRKDLVTQLLKLSGNTYGAWGYKDNSSYNALLYGTKNRTGLLETFFTRTKDGDYKFRKNKKIQGPFTKARPSTPAVSETTGIPVL